MDIIPKKISKQQAADAGMAAVLIFLLLGLFVQNSLFYKIAIPLLVINIIFPMFFYPFAFVWFGFSQLLGFLVSKLLLSVVFLVVVTPVGLIRKLAGKDTLRLKKFRKGDDSVMHTRNKIFTFKDIEKPY